MRIKGYIPVYHFGGYVPTVGGGILDAPLKIGTIIGSSSIENNVVPPARQGCRALRGRMQHTNKLKFTTFESLIPILREGGKYFHSIDKKDCNQNTPVIYY